jgi:hypothetical protein
VSAVDVYAVPGDIRMLLPFLAIDGCDVGDFGQPYVKKEFSKRKRNSCKFTPETSCKNWSGIQSRLLRGRAILATLSGLRGSHRRHFITSLSDETKTALKFSELGISGAHGL